MVPASLLVFGRDHRLNTPSEVLAHDAIDETDKTLLLKLGHTLWVLSNKEYVASYHPGDG